MLIFRTLCTQQTYTNIREHILEDIHIRT